MKNAEKINIILFLVNVLLLAVLFYRGCVFEKSIEKSFERLENIQRERAALYNRIEESNNRLRDSISSTGEELEQSQKIQSELYEGIIFSQERVGKIEKVGEEVDWRIRQIEKLVESLPDE